ncbi:uncharacterized protein [Palaemon carinicauda]|uniref:uncharacterized protein isoform X2 n=1 Tax=Palaemon carinicauda TaxID=392227 RepID=UPI0035B63763
MSYAVSEEKDNELRMDHRMTGYKVSLHSIWAESVFQTPLRSWVLFCFRYNYTTGEWAIFVNGELDANGTFPLKTYPLLGNGVYIIGQEQDSLGGGFQRDQSYSGEITDLNFWSRNLDQDLMKMMANCKYFEEGDALPWSNQSWKIHGDIRWITYARKDICNEKTRRITFFPDRFDLTSARKICHVLGGALAVPRNKEENAWLFSTSSYRAQHCSGNVGASYMWMGANDVTEEGVWRYWESNSVLPWQSLWRGDGPNGGSVENCLVMLAGSFPARWSDIACLDSYAFCVPCEFDRLKTLYLKGPAVCPGSPFNLQYILGENRGGRPSLVGFFHSDIFWDSNRKMWTLQSIKDKGMAWWKPPSEGMYPFGTHSWTLGTEVCDMIEGETVYLTISICGNGKFTCEDGTCIDLDQRCDLRVDCKDQSDEARCSLVDVPSGYRTTIPPPPPAGANSLPILFYINIISFPSIETEDLTFMTTLELKLRWKDTRLKYRNLKDDRSLNVLSQSSVAGIWKPRVFFSNAQGNVFTNFDEGSRIECVRLGNSVPGPPHLPEEVNLFSGSENSLEMSQLYGVTYTCDFNLLMFPFDAQVCGLRFTLVSATVSYMELVPWEANYTGSPNLIEYGIGEVSTKTISEGKFSTIEVQVRFQRRYGFYMLTLYIPTTFLIITAYATFYFNPYDFNSRIVVALTSLLVLSSLYTQTSNSLPKTSYFKLVDIWLFFAIVMIFIVVLLQTLIDFSEQFELEEDSYAYKFMRIIFGSCKTIKSSKGNRGGSLVMENGRGKTQSGVIQISVGQRQDHTSATKVRANCWDDQDNSSLKACGQLSNGRVLSPKVNMGLLVKSRILIPTIFFLFNSIYWGTAIRYLNMLEEDKNII